MKQIKIIDLFAGPGGLGEGFSAYRDTKGNSPFKIALSIEKEKSAHQTLTLRAFYRQFHDGKVPSQYYDFLRGKLGKTPDEQLYALFPVQAAQAKQEARCLTLGEDNHEIDKALDAALKKNEDCILIGGPPCQAYSLVGRSRRIGMAGYSPEEDERSYLYKEYLRIIKKCEPLVFVMENVKGVLSAEVDSENVFGQIIDDLRNPWGKGKGSRYRVISVVVPNSNEQDYNPKDFIIRAENYGIPQARHRVILLGLHKDIATRWNNSLALSAIPPVSLKQVIGKLPPLRSGLSKETDSIENWRNALNAFPKSAKKNLKKIADGIVEKQIDHALEVISESKLERGTNYSEADNHSRIYQGMPKELSAWYLDPKGEIIICNHNTRGHQRSDLHRYLFCAAWANAKIPGSPFPKPQDYPKQLIPDHANFNSGKFTDRFRVQIQDRYATTIPSHISKDGHYTIHYDTTQCRSLTVREAARIQTFPDNYFFMGERTQQYVQVGNAVPPFLARQIANVIYKLLGH
jgi:DNA (cytosine-5)-methyltransferase 1